MKYVQLYNLRGKVFHIQKSRKAICLLSKFPKKYTVITENIIEIINTKDETSSNSNDLLEVL